MEIPAKILISNDDGYDAEGLLVLKAALDRVAETVTVAPERNCSGFGSALSLRTSLVSRDRGDNIHSINGTPADCVHLSLNGLLDFPAEVVVSGINNGENMGDDTLYSGTVGAALEGRFLRYPALAVSLAGSELHHYDTAARVTVELLAWMTPEMTRHCRVFNVNVPDLPHDQLRGWQITRLGPRHPACPILRGEAVDGEAVHRIGPSGVPDNPGPGTDFHAVDNGFVSITPLTTDMTSFDALDALGGESPLRVVGR